MNIEQKLRTAEVRRWHIVRLSAEQTVGDHVYCVTQLAMELVRLLVIPNPSWTVGQLLEECLHHDIEESLTGDIPSPTKQQARKMGFDWNEAIHMLVPLAGPPAHPQIADIIKMADLLDAWRFVKKYKINNHGIVVENRLLAAINLHALMCGRAPHWTSFENEWRSFHLESRWELVTRQIMIDMFREPRELVDG